MTENPYLLAALGAGPNRTAAAATLAVVILVFGLSRVPIASGSEIDLRTPERLDGWTQVSLFGFGAPTPLGRAVTQPPGRLIWNRPLPDHFTVALDVVTGPKNRRVRVALGDFNEIVALPRTGPVLVEINNPQGLRELRIAPAAPGAHVQLRRVAVQ